MTQEPQHNAADETADEKGETAEDRHVESRAGLLPEERAAGSENPEAQAEEILEDSERRTLDPSGTRNASSQTLGEE